MTLITDLILQIRRMANVEHSQFVTDEELLGYVNQAHKKAYDMVVKANENYFIEDTPITISEEDVELPTNCYKVIGVDLKQSGRTYTMESFNIQERNKYWNTSKTKYCIIKNKLKFLPIPNSAMEGKLYFIPFPTTLTLEGAVDAPIAQWDNMLITYAAKKTLEKEESDARYVDAEYQECMAAIKDFVQSRDATEAFTIVDYYARNEDWGDV